MSKEKTSRPCEDEVHETGASLKHFFRKKYIVDEKLSKMLKTPKFWAAIIGELIGTMLLTMALMCTIGVFRADLVPLFIFAAFIAIYIGVYKISGAHLNPLLTAGAMATRRMSVWRGIFYIIAQFIGAGLGCLIMAAFKAGSGSDLEIPASLVTVSGDNFWAIALIELTCAIILGFIFTRSLQYAKKGQLLYAIVMACSIAVVYLLGIVISQSYYEEYASLIFNPASAVAFGIFSGTIEGIGQIALISLAYMIVPVIGGVVGAYLSDAVTELVGDGYEICEVDK